MNIRIIFLAILILIPMMDSFAGSGYYEDCYFETGDRISISVSGQTLKDTAQGVFFYSYTIKSSKQSQQNVWVFSIILPEKSIIIDAVAPVGWGTWLVRKAN